MNETPDATAIFAPIWRRSRLIHAVGIPVAAVSYLHFKRQRPVYRAPTRAHLGVSFEAQIPSDKGDATVHERSASSQATLTSSAGHAHSGPHLGRYDARLAAG